ncbi:2-oxoglutarate dehydrogenase, E2 component, dihydrolipoamide succinyltransferase [Euzebya sp.]|uniref:2-oxoglutarate dehydrogenase, E2 component, dihydrolipoamide succinyltransferase n=1 Tax=Euzebya sp. TaxID=1971409 RepID=UPI0035190895
MATDVELPQLGESVTEGTITEWLVEVGDTVEADQPLFELSSDKIDTEVPAPASGTLIEILVQVDETVEVGTVVARIGEPDEADGDGGGGSDDGADEDAEQSDGSDDESGDEDAQLDEGVEAAESEGAPADMTSDEGDEDEDADDDGQDAGGQAQDGGGDGGGETVDVTLPELGESVTEGTVTEWLVEVGDTVEADQPLFELSSDKIDTEVPSPAAGTITEILVDVDETVEVGTVVARIGSGAAGGGGGGGDERSSREESADEPSSGGDERPSDSRSAQTGEAPATAQGSDALASPLVRKLANDNGIDLDSLEGSGQGGRITREDVEAAIDGGGQQAAEPEKAPQKSSASKPGGKPSKGSDEPREPARAPGDRERVEDLSRIRQRIAERMLESQSQTASLTTVQEADVTALMAARARHKETFASREGVSLSPFAIVARAALMAVRNHPMVNAYADWDNGKLYLRDYVNLGIAVDTPKGLLVPNIKGADGLTVGGLARGIVEAAQKARGENGRKLDFADIEGGTFTLTNTGSRGVLIDTPILNYPEVAILGIGAIKKRPAVVEGPDGGEAIAVRQLMYLSLTYDHRLLDGADAARFVTDVKEVLETTDWDQEIG